MLQVLAGVRQSVHGEHEHSCGNHGDHSHNLGGDSHNQGSHSHIHGEDHGMVRKARGPPLASLSEVKRKRTPQSTTAPNTSYLSCFGEQF